MKKSKNVLWKKVYENLYELLLAAIEKLIIALIIYCK